MTVSALHLVEGPTQAAAMLHPTRLRILSELDQPDSATGLARRLRLSRQQVNYHVRHLEADGLVEMVEERRKRNCTERVVRAVAQSYLIAPAALGPIAADPARIRDRTSSAYLIAAAAQVIQEVADGRSAASRQGKSLPTLTLQTDVRFGSAAEQHAFGAELAGAVAAVVARYHRDDAPAGRTFRVMTGAYPAPHQPKTPEQEKGR